MLFTKEMFEPDTLVVPTPSPAVPPRADQAGKGVAGKIGRFLAEPAFIAGCGLAGALYEAHYGSHSGQAPVIGIAATAASLAISVGTARLLVKVYRAKALTLGTLGCLVLRFAVTLLCLGFQTYGLSCMCDDVSTQTYTGMVRFE